MKSARCLLVGRNISKEILSDSGKPPIRVPVTIEPIEVQVTVRLIAIEVRHIDVTIGVTPLNCTEHHRDHRFLNSSKSCILLGFSPQYSVPSIFFSNLKDRWCSFFQAYPKELYSKRVLGKQTKAIALIFSLSS